MPECRIRNFKIHIEVPLMLVFFAIYVSDAVFTNLAIYRTCYTTLGYNEMECALLGSGTKDDNARHLEELVEPHAANINMVRAFIESLGGAFVCLFFGPWSDKFGRKPVILICSICYALKFCIQTVLCWFYYSSPWYYVVASLPVVLSGGMAAFVSALTSYISDVSTEYNGGFRMSVFEAVVAISVLFGNLTSPYLFYATSYAAVFGVSCGCCLLAAVFAYVFIPESVTTAKSEGSFRELFRLSHVKDMYTTIVKRRENHRREIILLCVLSLSVYVAVSNGSTSILFLFLRDKFQWSLKKFTMFNCMSNLLYATGSVFATYVLSKFLKITNSVLILIGYISMLNCMLVQGLAQKDWHIYFSTGVHGLSGVVSPLSRMLASKSATPEECGKVFSSITIAESLFTMVGSPFFTEIYNATITTNPELFNFVSCGFYLFNCLLILIIIWMEVPDSNTSPYVRIDGEDYNENLTV